MAIKGSGSVGRSYDRARTKAGEATAARDLFRTEAKEPRQKITLDISATTYRTLKVHAAQEGTTMRDLVSRYVRAGLDADGVQGR